MTSQQNYINHIVMVLDMSGSMGPHARELVKVADGQIAHLARRSQELDQETRITVYVFDNIVECVIYDKDVLRLPSIASFYRPRGGTALIDATMQAIEELRETPERYGDHAFLIYVLTDGEENSSRKYRSGNLLTTCINGLPGHWTVAALVPNQTGKYEAKSFGFPPDNIAIWNADSAEGVAEAGVTIRNATESFMTGRAQGIRGSRAIFSTGVDAVNKAAIKAAALDALPKSAYEVLRVTKDAPIREYVQERGRAYEIGHAFYQLSKAESIQSHKAVAVRERSSGKVYHGPGARGMVGLPAMEVRVKPDYNPDYDIFVQSTSVNRKLVKGTDLLLVK